MKTLCTTLALFSLLCLGGVAQGQLTQDQMADMILSSARKAYNEKNHAFAVTRFREFLAKFGGHKDAPAARFGLALALLDGADKNFAEARDLLQSVASNKDAADHGQVLYHLGLAARGLGLQELAAAEAKPQEAPQRRVGAQQRFEEASKYFAAAQDAFGKDVKVAANAKELPLEMEWSLRARCEHAEMLLRLNKAKEAQAVARPFVAEPLLAMSRFRHQGRYYFGYASFLLKDYAAAEQALSMLAPFTDAGFGNHARYLLARTHHLADERAEAALHYEGVLADFAKSKTAAQALLKQPEKLKNDPAEKARLEALANGPPPDHLARSSFYLGVLQYEAGKFFDAKTRFADVLKQFPTLAWKHEIELRIGFSQVQLKEYAESIKTLTPLEKDSRVGDLALLWLAKAQAGMAPDATADAPGHDKALKLALATYRQAADRAAKAPVPEAEGRERRGEALLELADTLQALKQGKEAAAIYQQLLGDKLLPARDEEISQRLTIALHLAGDFNEADKACTHFMDKYAKSTLLPAVLFCFAENSYFRALAADKIASPADRAKELTRLHAETVKRFQVLIDRFPEYARIHLARYSLGLTFYRMGELDKARDTWNTIPVSERQGELALTPYLMADCLLRQTPSTVPEDALAAGKMEEQLKTASELLDAFVGSNPKDSMTADAILKQGLSLQRLASLLAQPPERIKVFMQARAVYEKLLAKEYAGHPLQPQAIFERAKCSALAGDMGNAQKELTRFTQDPLVSSSVAPMAQLHLATLLRGQNKINEAVALLARARELYEPSLGKNPERARWVALLRYHHGVALREAAKLPEARGVLELVVKQGGDPALVGEAALRIGQCLKDEGQLKLDLGRKLLSSSKKSEETAQAQKIVGEGFKLLRDAAEYLENQAEQLKKQDAAAEVRSRMLYDAAWTMRLAAEPEVQAARLQLHLEMVKKLGDKLGKFPLPEVPLAKVPLQPAEKKAHALYQAMIATAPDLPLALEARFELAELLAQRDHFDPALQLLNEALDKEPGPEATDRIRLRLGTLHAAKGNSKGALAQYDVVAQNPKSALYPQAVYRAGEALLAAKDYEQAAKRLALFYSQPPLQNVAGLSDRALLRLGHAHAFLKNWEESRKAHERVLGTFPSSPWVDEARYGLGLALFQLRQYDPAVVAFTQVTTRTASELGAKAQLQIGLCRLEQKKYQEAATALLVVPFTYDYPDLSAAALLEAARAFQELKQPAQATKLLERVMQDYANTPWAEAARERLKGLDEKR